MAATYPERMSTPAPDPLWWRVVTGPLWAGMKNKLTYPLDGPALKEQERITRENEELHKLARKAELILIPLAIAALAIVGWNNRDQIASVVNLGGANSEPNPTNVAGVPKSTLAALDNLKTPTPTNTEISPTPKPTETLTPFPTPAEVLTLVPATEVPVQVWAPKTFQNYEAMLKNQGIKLVDFGESSSHRYDLPNVSSYSLPGFDLNIGIASGVTLVDYQPDFGPNGQKNLIFGFSRGGVNHLFLVKTATCKLVDTWMSPSIATLKQGMSYSLDIISGFVSDLGVLVNGSNCGVEYSDLTRTKPTELNYYFSGTVNRGEVDDLSSKFLVYRIRR